MALDGRKYDITCCQIDIGNVYVTTSKPGKPGTGLGPLERAARAAGRVPLLAIGGVTGEGADMLVNDLTEAVFATKRFDLLDRKDIDKVMEEQNLSVSGLVNSETEVPIDALEAYTEETNGANLQADAAIFELVKRYRGSISAEHGIGLLKRPWLDRVRSKDEIEFMRGIKRVFDPAGIFNPGKLL